MSSTTPTMNANEVQTENHSDIQTQAELNQPHSTMNSNTITNTNIIRVKFLSPTGAELNFTLDFPELPIPISQLREAVAEQVDIPSSLARLIFRGRVLQNQHSTDTYGIQHESTIHLVKKPSSPTSSSSSSSSHTDSQVPTNNTASSSSNTSASTTTTTTNNLDPSNFFGRRVVGIVTNSTSANLPLPITSLLNQLFPSYEGNVVTIRQNSSLPTANLSSSPSSSSSSTSDSSSTHADMNASSTTSSSSSSLSSSSSTSSSTSSSSLPSTSSSPSPSTRIPIFSTQVDVLLRAPVVVSPHRPRSNLVRRTFSHRRVSSETAVSPSSANASNSSSTSLSPSFPPSLAPTIPSTDSTSLNNSSQYIRTENNLERTVALLEQTFLAVGNAKKAISTFHDFLSSTTLSTADPVQVLSHFEAFIAQRFSTSLSPLVSHFTSNHTHSIFSRINDVFFMHRQLCHSYANHSSCMEARLSSNTTTTTTTSTEASLSQLRTDIAWQAHAYISSCFSIASQYIARLVSATTPSSLPPPSSSSSSTNITPSSSSTFALQPATSSLVQHEPVGSPSHAFTHSTTMVLQFLQSYLCLLDEQHQRSTFLSMDAPYMPSSMTPLSELFNVSFMHPLLQLLFSRITVAQLLQFIPHPHLFYLHIHPILNHFIRNIASIESAASEDSIHHVSLDWLNSFMTFSHQLDLSLNRDDRSLYISILHEVLTFMFRKLIVAIVISPDPFQGLSDWFPSFIKLWKRELSTRFCVTTSHTLFDSIRKMVFALLSLQGIFDLLPPSSTFMSAFTDSITRCILAL